MSNVCIGCGEQESEELQLIRCTNCQLGQCMFCADGIEACPSCDEPVKIVSTMSHSTHSVDFTSAFSGSYQPFAAPQALSWGSFLSSAFQPTIERVDPFTYIKEATTRVGLPNYNNSCFVNCVMQIFLHEQELFSLLMTSFASCTSEGLLKAIRHEYCKSVGVGSTEQCDATLFFNFCLERIEAKDAHVKELWKQKWVTKYQCQQCHLVTQTNVQEENMYILYPVAPSEHLAPDEEEVVIDEQNREFDYDMTSCIEAQRQPIVT